ncbi:MAG: 1-deoxy-D-xylulose-5-phosphate reductoisomerase [Candidatus Kapaibacterium sp.]
MRKTITILGSTGSIGTQALAVIAAHHPDVEIAYLTTRSNIDLVSQQLRRFSVRGVAIADEHAAAEFRKHSDFKGEILVGDEGVCRAAGFDGNDLVLSALVGFSGVLPTLAAIEQGTTVALANKETLVSAGSVVMDRARQRGVDIIAVDSEHSAILQCLVGEEKESIEKLVITASGGPFRTFSAAELQTVTVEQALRHPNWDMGAKITIDSSTLMNKGFEVIEAHWLFGLPAERIDVVVHPQSLVHSFVQFVDGSLKAQIGLPDMNLPIHYALTFPRRGPTAFRRFDVASVANWTFEKPDIGRFPCLGIAYDAMRAGGVVPAVMNAANEIAVARFLRKDLRYVDIPRVIEGTIRAMNGPDVPSLPDIIDADHEARSIAQTLHFV